MSRSQPERRSPDELCREAIRLLEDTMQKSPAELKAEVDVAERTVAMVVGARSRDYALAHDRFAVRSLSSISQAWSSV